MVHLRLSLTKSDEVLKRFQAVLRKKKPHFAFHCRGGTMNRSLLEEFYKITSAAAVEKGKYLQLSVNTTQSVITIRIKDKRMQEEICLEEVNEGEQQE